MSEPDDLIEAIEDAIDDFANACVDLTEAHGTDTRRLEIAALKARTKLSRMILDLVSSPVPENSA